MESWRDVLPIHPAANLFPRMSDGELRVLGEDIKANGLHVPLIFWAETQEDAGHLKVHVLDGINRLDAMEAVGIEVIDDDGLLDLLQCSHGHEIEPYEILVGDDPDPYAAAVSANIHRRHLDAEQRRELIAKCIAAQPNVSNREIARQVKASPTIVGEVRGELSKRGQLPEKTIGRDGKARPATRRIRHRASRARDGEDDAHSWRVIADTSVENTGATVRGWPREVQLRFLFGLLTELQIPLDEFVRARPREARETEAAISEPAP